MNNRSRVNVIPRNKNDRISTVFTLFTRRRLFMKRVLYYDPISVIIMPWIYIKASEEFFYPHTVMTLCLTPLCCQVTLSSSFSSFYSLLANPQNCRQWTKCRGSDSKQGQLNALALFYARHWRSFFILPAQCHFP